MVTAVRLTRFLNKESTILTIASDGEYKLKSLILIVALIKTIVPKKPLVPITMDIMSEDWITCANTTPINPIKYSPSVIPRMVCLIISALKRSKGVLTGDILAAAMKLPATIVAPACMEIGSPGGGKLISSPKQ